MNAVADKAQRAVVLLSGGLDSATVLAIAQASGYRCVTVAVDYGQRHRAELDAARNVSQTLGAERHVVIPIGLDRIGGSALTDAAMAVPTGGPDVGIPVTYVPARNTIFLSLALGVAETCGAHDIFLGVNAVDYSGYPDCRPDFIKAFAAMASLATRDAVESGQGIRLQTPLMALSKAEIIRKGIELGIDYANTVSCYQADAHGHACGVCDSCYFRRQGFDQAGVPDPTLYAT